MSKRLLGVVLCGGKSLRMGQDKSTLSHSNGKSFLEHAIARLSAVCDQVVISGHASANHGTLLLKDPTAYQGPVIGIASALRFASRNSFDACFFTPIDVPSLTVDDLIKLKERWLTAGVQPTLGHSNQIEPLIGIYPVGMSDKMEELSQGHDRSLFRWFQSQTYLAVNLPEASCRNINSPEDLSHGS